MINQNWFPTVAVRSRAGGPVRQWMFVALLLVTAGPGRAADLSDAALQQIQALQAEKLSRSTTHRKLDSQFVFQLKQNRGQAIAQGVTRLRPDIKLQSDGRVLVDIDANVTEALLAQIQQSGGTVINNFPQYRAIRALVTLDQLESLAGSVDVKFIRRAREARTHTGSVTSEGDTTHRANIARNTFGATGQNVKVGVLSDSISYLAYAQSSGDLPAVTVLPGQDGAGSGEGTAMLEIIHDLAPGANLYFATAFNGEASFANNILSLRSNGCDVIVDDVFYFDESPFQDGIIAQAVNTVTADGAMYFSSAGNEGNLQDQTSGTWEGDFVDGGPAGPPVNIGGGKIHSFGATTFNTVISPGYGVDLFWADPLGASGNDYDLFVLDWTGTNVVSSSLNLQDGTQDPYEQIYNVASGNRIVVVKASGAARFIHLRTTRGTLSISTSGAIKGHSAAAAAFSVAAVDAATSFPGAFSGGLQNPVETFSSDGPRRIFFQADGTPITPGNFSSTGGTVRPKPDIAAADGVQTLVFGSFFGTSAAAPHAAAIGALLLSYDPTLTASQLRTALTSTALDIEAPGIDLNSGAGLVMADLALQSLPPRPVIIASGATLLAESCPNDVLDPAETVTVNFSLRNVGVTDTANLVVTLLDSGGVTTPSGPHNYGVVIAKGSPVSRQFSFVSAGICGGTNIATLQLQDGTNDLGRVNFAFRVGSQRVPLAENFDNVAAPALPAGWTAFLSGSGPGWVTTNFAIDSPPNSAFVPDPNAVSDKRLTSPVFPVATASAQLTFRHRLYTYNYGYDGGVLEISANGGVFTDILAAGGSFLMNGYYQTLYTGYGNPLQGRQAWTGSSGGFITTIVNLPAAAAGKNVQLRWRFGSGSSFGGGEGWYIDTVSLNDGVGCCGTVPNDLVVRITDAPDPVVVGGNLNYTINIFNTGPAAATGVILTDVLPTNFTFQSFTFSPGVVPGPVPNGGGTISFNLATLAGGSSATVVISGIADALGLMTNRVLVSRTDPDANTNNNSATAATLVILPSLSINDVMLFEGNSGTTNAVFTASLWPPPGRTVTVHYATSNLTAAAGSDFASTSGTLVFAPGVTNRPIVIPVIGDQVNEADEAFVVDLSSPTNALLALGQGVGTILNDDPLPTLSVSDATMVVPKSGTTNALFNVRLSARSGQIVTVYANTSDGTAHSGSDYDPFYSTPLYFNPGETNKTIVIGVKAHVSAKPSQMFFFNLSTVSNAKLGHNPGLGNVITALPGQVDHFGWSTISSPQSNGLPFAVSITARDFWNSAVSNFNGMARLFAASGSGGLQQSGGLVPYFTDNNPSATGPESPILQAGFTPLHVTDITTLNLNAYDMIFIDETDNGFVSSGLLARLAEIQDWVNNGGSLIVHDRSAGNISSNPFLLGTTGITTVRQATSDIDVIAPGANLVVAGPFGTIGNSTLDGGNSSAHGYVPENQLPAAALPILSIGGNPSQIVAFSYPLGSGRVYYSTIPLDCYLEAGGCGGSVIADPLQHIYTPNVLAYASRGSSVAVPITPTNSGNFVNGTWTGNITVQQPATNVVLRADDGLGHVGQSNPFDVLPTRGQVTHFAWSPISSPQSNGAPFAVSITAQDYFNDTASNFTGTVAFSGTGAVATRSNTILSAPVHSDLSSGNYTFGYSFTPRTNITVTHVRHYFGNLVSIWNNAGVLLASRSVASIAGTWRETALLTPLQLLAGQTYRIGVYAGGGNYYWRNDLAGSFPDGSINQGYEVSGSGFPTNTSGPRWWFVDLRYSADLPGPIFVNPTSSGNFSGGVWSGNLAVFQAATNATLRADDGIGHLGQSLPFTVAPAPGQVTRFAWNTIPSPQSNGAPFAVTITARDYLNATASNFTGIVALSGTGVVGARITNILGAPIHTSSSSGTYTFGHAFTPNTNLTVTHVRHYYGSRVSIWTDAGVLLAAQNVSSTDGTWRETALPTPVQLLAGQRYRVGVYTTGNYYYRFDMLGTFPDGTIDQAYYVSGNAFPNNTDGARWQFVDLRYQVDTSGPVPVSPANSGNFVGGVWSGSVTMPQPGTNVTVRADDDLGHNGLSNPFNVALQNDISLVMSDSPDPVFRGGILNYSLLVSNIGPTAATGVVVTNFLPPGVTLVSAISPQGIWSSVGSAMICALGTLPGGTGVTLTIAVQPNALGLITNLATVTRNEADVLLGNNTASAVTRVRSSFGARVAIYGAPSDVVWSADVRDKLVSAGATAIAGSFGSVSEFLVKSGFPVPTLAELQQYDAVLVYSGTSFNDSTAFGDVLADYADGGGGVVLATYAFYTGGGSGISGRLSTGGYLPFTLGSSSSGGSLSLVADDPSHPILSGISSFNGGPGSYHNSPINPTDGTELIAHWNNNQPLVGAKLLTSGRVVGLNFYPPSSDVSSDFWQSGTDGGLLMANALLWAAQHTNDISLSVTGTPDLVDIRSNLTYTITIHNSGPGTSTGVTLTNLLPASLYFVSVTTSQGAANHVGESVVCNLGTLVAGASANVTLVTRPNADGPITNVFTVTRTEAESHLANNTASVVSQVLVPGAGGSFQITSMSSAGAVAIEVGSFTGDDRGGLALSSTTAFLTGDSSTARFNASNLSGGAALGQVRDSLVADLKTEQVYLLGNGAIPITSSGGTVNTLLELNGSTGALTGNSIPLSTPISLLNNGNVGIFSGYGQVVLHTGSRVYSIAVPSGQVTDLGAMSTPSHQGSENWAYWGVAENFGGSIYLVYVQSSTTIARTRVSTGVTTTLASFSNLSDMASITVSIPRNRWYFHHEGTSQFLSGDEILGYATAAFSVSPGIVTLANDLVLSASGSPSPAPAGAMVTYTLRVTNTGPSLATGVLLSNVPPAGANLISFSSGQAASSNVGGVLVFDFGSLPAGTNVTATVVVQAPSGGILTNVATVARSQPDAYTPNNRAEVLTPVLTTPALSIADASVAEGHVGTTNLVFAVTLTTSSTQAITVNYTTANGAAGAGSDYTGTNGVLTFPPGTTNRAIAVAVLGDLLVEGNETLFVNLSSPSNAVFGRSQAVGTVVNDDGLAGQVNHFVWSTIPSPQFNGALFTVNITARDYFNNAASNFTGVVSLGGVTGATSNSLPVSPASSGNFSNGVWTGSVMVQQLGTNVILWAADEFGHSGQSLPLDVVNAPVPPVTITFQTSGGQMHLTWPNGILQSASQAAGPYTDVIGATSPHSVTFSAPRQFFRVRVN